MLLTCYIVNVQLKNPNDTCTFLYMLYFIQSYLHTHVTLCGLSMYSPNPVLLLFVVVASRRLGKR